MISVKTLLFILKYAYMLCEKSKYGNSFECMIIDIIDSDTVKFIATNGASMMVVTVPLKNHTFLTSKQYMIHRGHLLILKGVVSKFTTSHVNMCLLGNEILFIGNQAHATSLTTDIPLDYQTVLDYPDSSVEALFNEKYLKTVTSILFEVSPFEKQLCTISGNKPLIIKAYPQREDITEIELVIMQVKADH